MAAEPTGDEASRRAVALARYGIEQAADNPRFQRIASLAARVLGAPVVGIALSDGQREWLLASVGADSGEAPVLASVPLVDPDGVTLGSLWVADPAPRPALADTDAALLADLAALAVDELLLHRAWVEAEAAKRDAALASRTRSDFLAFMSHELRTPLNAVIGFAELMEAQPFGPMGSPRYLHYAQMIHAGGQHLLNAINAILDIGRIEAGRYELSRAPLDIADEIAVVLGLVRGQAEAKGVEVVLASDPRGLPVISADAAALRQALFNLAGNAIKFTPASGSVSIAVEADGSVVRIVVRDTGIGIAPEFLSGLGEPAYLAGSVLARRTEGSGLGLAIAAHLVRLHGGQLSIESVLDQGTTVTVTLPVNI